MTVLTDVVNDELSVGCVESERGVSWRVVAWWEVEVGERRDTHFFQQLYRESICPEPPLSTRREAGKKKLHIC